MLQNLLLTPEEVAVRDEVREFVRTQVPADLLHRMDRDEITFDPVNERSAEVRSLIAQYSDRGQ